MLIITVDYRAQICVLPAVHPDIAIVPMIMLKAGYFTPTYDNYSF